MNKTFIFTDVHGCGKELEKLVLPFVHDCDLYSLGDNFDRAFDGVKVYEILRKYDVRCIMGNHEHKMLEYLEGRRSWLPKHYYYFLHEFTKKYKIQELVDFIKSMKLLIPLDDEYILTHAGINLDDPYKEDLSANVYGRYEGKYDWVDHYNDIPTIVYGHVVHTDVLHHNRTIGLDTGACHGQKLIGMCIDDGTHLFHHINTENYYGEMKHLEIPQFNI